MTGVSFGSYSVTYSIDGRGRITGISAPEGGYSFSYLEDGFKRTLVTYPNGVKETRGYDALARQTNLVYKKWLTTLLAINYCHDNGDRRTNEVWSTGRDLAYGYDRAHQLLDVASTSRASDTASYRYDKAGNPIRRTEMGLGVTNSFNNLNQIVSGIWTGGAVTVAGAVNFAAGTVTVNSATGKIFSDSVFEVTNVTVSAGTNVLTAVYHGPGFTNTQMVATDKVTVVVGNSSYTHDANGNLTGDENFTYQYDLANRLTNVILKASNTAVFAANYDGLGRRIQVVRNGSTTERYVYLPGSFLMLAILDGNNAVKESYTQGADLSGTMGGAGGIGGIMAAKYSQQTNAPVFFLHPDARGNVVLATDSQGTEAGRFQYSQFGRPITTSGSFVPRTLFSSKERDPETGLLNFGYRHLNPALGRWMARDRIAENGGINLYAYGPNSPANGIDALGKEWSNADAVRHFYTGKGRAVTIDEIGLRAKISSAAKPRMDEFEQIAQSASLAAGMKIDCAIANPRWKKAHIQHTDSVGVNSGVFWIGGFSLARQYDCRIEVDCGKCTGHYECDLWYFMDDEFRDPLDFDNSGGKDFWDHWQVGGTPFFVRGFWEKQIDGKFAK